MSNMKHSEIVGKVLRGAYCMDLEDFLKAFGWEEDPYSLSKFKKMQADFSVFYCELDKANAQRFCNYIINKK